MAYADIVYGRTKNAGHRFLACSVDISKQHKDTLLGLLSRHKYTSGWLVRADADHVIIGYDGMRQSLFGETYKGINMARIDGREGGAFAGVVISRGKFDYFPIGSFGRILPDYLHRLGDYFVKHYDAFDNGVDSDFTTTHYERELPNATGLAEEIDAIAKRIHAGEHFECAVDTEGKVKFFDLYEVERAAKQAAEKQAQAKRLTGEAADIEADHGLSKLRQSQAKRLAEEAAEAEKLRLLGQAKKSFLECHWGKFLGGTALIGGMAVSRAFISLAIVAGTAVIGWWVYRSVKGTGTPNGHSRDARDPYTSQHAFPPSPVAQNADDSAAERKPTGLQRRF